MYSEPFGGHRPRGPPVDRGRPDHCRRTEQQQHERRMSRADPNTAGPPVPAFRRHPNHNP